jgi:signal transduction histidine kinase
MSSEFQKPSPQETSGQITEEYRVLHKVAQILQNPGELNDILQKTMQAITEFEGLQVENKAGIFLADYKDKVLRLFTTYGAFSQEFLEKEKEVPFGDCLCGRVAISGKLLMSESCFTDPRHERTFTDMKAHGHYIVPLKSLDNLIGVMFLYTNTYPSWYQHSQEVLLSIGGLIANTIQGKQIEDELSKHRNLLETLVESRTLVLRSTNNRLKIEIEEHERTQQNLINSKEKFRKLSNQIQAIREEEKSRIAREVHDQLGQALTALKIDTIQMEKKIPTDLPDLRSQAKSMTKVVDDTIKNVQQIAMELRPPVLDAFGICEAIAWQAGEYKAKLGLHFDLNCLQEHIDLEKGLQTALFRIFQESVTNIVRHAKATEIQVSMNYDNGKLIFEIVDNGIGIKKEAIDSSESLGLVGMKERVHSWSGEVDFEGSTGKGTKVTITIPLTLK